jgi:hypothetical protein
VAIKETKKENKMQTCTTEMTRQVYGGGFWDFLKIDSGTSQGVRKDGNALGAGCGTVKSDAFVPDILFGINVSQACFEHDQSYATCGMDRLTADMNLSRNIMNQCDLQGGKELTCDVIAGIYGVSVFLFGARAYQEAQSQSCE